MSNHNGGPAFPGPCQHETSIDINEGMSLRDHFAGEALGGILAYSHVSNRNGNWHENSGDPTELAMKCYEIADAMLAVRDIPTIPRPST